MKEVTMNENDNREVISHEKELTCYECGVKFGRCGTQIFYDMPFDIADDIRIPEHCKSDPKTFEGIRDGTEEVYAMARSITQQMNDKYNQTKE